MENLLADKSAVPNIIFAFIWGVLSFLSIPSLALVQYYYAKNEPLFLPGA